MPANDGPATAVDVGLRRSKRLAARSGTTKASTQKMPANDGPATTVDVGLLVRRSKRVVARSGTTKATSQTTAVESSPTAATAAVGVTSTAHCTLASSRPTPATTSSGAAMTNWNLASSRPMSASTSSGAAVMNCTLASSRPTPATTSSGAAMTNWTLASSRPTPATTSSGAAMTNWNLASSRPMSASTSSGAAVTNCTLASTLIARTALRLNPTAAPYILPPIFRHPINNTTNVASNNLTIQNAVVKFKRLSFYETVKVLIRPTALVPSNGWGMQSQLFVFYLSVVQAMKVNKKIGQVQIRFAILDSSVEQNDCFPPDLELTCNGCFFPIPKLTVDDEDFGRYSDGEPIHISEPVKFSPGKNYVRVGWASYSTRKFACTMNLVKRAGATDLISRLKSKKRFTDTKALIISKLKETDSDITTTALRFSLVCPIGRTRMVTPCRSINCSHIQCFDASVYISMNEKSEKWKCPHCNKKAVYNDLLIDDYFLNVLSSPTLSSDANEIELNKDGTWSNIQSSIISLDNVEIEDLSDQIEIIDLS